MEFERLNLKDLRKVKKTAETYRKVFAGPQWKEVSRCPKFDKFYGAENPPGSKCPCGCGKLEEAYPPVKTTKYILSETALPDTVAIVKEEEGKQKGFGWGFRLSGRGFAMKKYEEENAEFIENLVGSGIEYFYISEVGVAPENQGQKLGGKITRKLAEEGENKGLPLLLRTIKTSTMAFTAKNMGMEVIMGDVDDENIPKDPENPDRLLFVKSK